MPTSSNISQVSISSCVELSWKRTDRPVKICHFIHHALNPGSLPGRSPPKVLVHCICGISRSATAICVYLIWARNMSLKKAYEFLKTKRTCMSPNVGFQFQLRLWQVLDCRLLLQFYAGQEKDMAIIDTRLRDRNATAHLEGTRIHIIGNVSSREDGFWHETA